MGSAVRRARTLNILEKLQSTCSSIEPKSVQVEKRVLTGFHKQTSMNLKPLSMRVATHWINTKSLALSSMIPSTPNLSFSLCTQCLKSSLISWICLPKHAHIRVYMSLTVSPLQPFTIYIDICYVSIGFWMSSKRSLSWICLSRMSSTRSLSCVCLSRSLKDKV